MFHADVLCRQCDFRCGSASGSAARVSALLDTYASETSKVFSVWRQFSEEDLSFRPMPDQALCSTYSSINFFQRDDSSASSWEYPSHLHQRCCPNRSA